MRQVNFTDLKAHFGEFVDLVGDGPIEVLRGGKPVGVFLSPDAFAHLQRLDGYWLARAQAAEASSERVGHDEAMRLLTERLKQSTMPERVLHKHSFVRRGGQGWGCSLAWSWYNSSYRMDPRVP